MSRPILHIDQVLPQIIDILERYNRSSTVQNITSETDLSADLSLDSLGVMDLMMDLEEKFDITIPLNLMPEIKTVDDLANIIIKLATKEGQGVDHGVI